MIKSFVCDAISFDPNNNLNAATKFLNATGNFLLKPARYLFHGKSVHCVLVPIDPKIAAPLYEYKEKPSSQGLERLFKTIISIVLLTPGTILGCIFKGTAWITSERLRRRYTRLKEDENILKNPISKAEVDLAIGLYKKDSLKIYRVLQNLKTIHKFDEFMEDFVSASLNRLGGNIAYLHTDYPYLYPNFRDKRVCDRRVEHTIACFFKFYAEDKIATHKFFQKMKELDKYAKYFSDENKTIDPIQSRIDLDADWESNIKKIEEYLTIKQFFI